MAKEVEFNPLWLIPLIICLTIGFVAGLYVASKNYECEECDECPIQIPCPQCSCPDVMCPTVNCASCPACVCDYVANIGQKVHCKTPHTQCINWNSTVNVRCNDLLTRRVFDCETETWLKGDVDEDGFIQ